MVLVPKESNSVQKDKHDHDHEKQQPKVHMPLLDEKARSKAKKINEKVPNKTENVKTEVTSKEQLKALGEANDSNPKQTTEKGKKSLVEAKSKQGKSATKDSKSTVQMGPKESAPVGDSKLSSLPSGIPSSLKNREDFQNSRKTLHWMRAWIAQLNTISLVYAFIFLMSGILQEVFDQNSLDQAKTYMLVYGLVAVFPLISSPCGYLSYHLKSWTLLAASVVLNIAYILLATLYLFLMFLLIRPSGFRQDIVLLTLIGISLTLAIALLCLHCALLKQLGIIRVVVKPSKEEKETKKEGKETKSKHAEESKSKKSNKPIKAKPTEVKHSDAKTKQSH